MLTIASLISTQYSTDFVNMAVNMLAKAYYIQNDLYLEVMC